MMKCIAGIQTDMDNEPDWQGTGRGYIDVIPVISGGI